MSSHELQFPQYPSLEAVSIMGSIAVVGAGKVGLSIAMRLHAQQQLEWVLVRSAERRRDLGYALEGVSLVATFDDAPTIPDTIIIAVSDSAIAELSEQIAEAFGPALENCLVLHTSGFLGSEVLSSCERAGARIAAAHPFQTFTHAHERLLSGISWGIECAPDVETQVSQLVRSLGGTPMMLSPFARTHKSLYHITAVFASNYVEALLASSRDMADAVQIPPTTFLQPIVQSAVEASMLSMAHGGRPPLSGPIARGDVQTIRVHLDSLQAYPGLFRQYCYFGLATNEFAFEHGYVNESVYSDIRSTLEKSLAEYRG